MSDVWKTTPACPIFPEHSTVNVTDKAVEYAEKANCVACCYQGSTPSLGFVWYVGVADEANNKYYDCDGNEVDKAKVAYKVYPCHSIYDTRMRIGIGPKFN